MRVTRALGAVALAALLAGCAMPAQAQTGGQPADIGYVNRADIQSYFTARGASREQAAQRSLSAIQSAGAKIPIRLIVHEAVFVEPARIVTPSVLADLDGRAIEPLHWPQTGDSLRVAVLRREQASRKLAPMPGDSVAERIDRTLKSMAAQFQLDLVIDAAEVAWFDPVLDITDQVLLAAGGKPADAAHMGAIPKMGAKIACVNASRALRESKPARAAYQRLVNEFTPREKLLKESFDRDPRSEEYRRAREQFNEDLRRRRSAELDSVVKITNDAIRSIGNEGRYDLILQDLPYCYAKFDLTPELMARLGD